ncbi:unnamed protein product [Clavelina lepadiformis]|uniref:LITAF domain-containing protein n=1 Tax=Clavelina lepadiformis TaxID=159417 RepID=A0ABP0GVY5_CLALP
MKMTSTPPPYKPGAYDTGGQFGTQFNSNIPPPPPPPPGFVATAGPTVPGGHFVVTQQPLIKQKIPTSMVCPHCNTNIVTACKAKVGVGTYVVCGILAAVGCWLGCCLIPFCIDDCKDVVHDCPSCHRTLHVNKFLDG